MSSWRRKAIDCLPEFKKDFEHPTTSIYDVFFELLPATINAHKTGETARLSVFYDFAEWCIKQSEKDLWNAVSVAFYEHLGDYEETRKALSQWVKPDIYKQIRCLIEIRVTEADLKLIDAQYKIPFRKN